MLRTFTGGVVVATAAGIVVLVGGSIGVTSIWPLLLAAAIALAAGADVGTRTAAAAGGAIVGFAASGVEIGVLPATTGALAVVTVVAVLLLAGVAALSGGVLPLWASLAGYAAFAGLYGPIGAESPTRFLSDAPVALVTVLLALGLGALTAIAADLVGSARRVEGPAEPLRRTEEVA